MRAQSTVTCVACKLKRLPEIKERYIELVPHYEFEFQSSFNGDICFWTSEDSDSFKIGQKYELSIK